ncbi:hypothetical protein AFLA_009274 [Aspergillus flavus NRRL3357]|nr:hypothetical protein AFLA_009274 [Aspergillus flavus NRRL3357]
MVSAVKAMVGVIFLFFLAVNVQMLLAAEILAGIRDIPSWSKKQSETRFFVGFCGIPQASFRVACLFAIPKDMLENCDLAWALCDSLYDKTPSAAGYICSLSSAVHDLDVCMATWLLIRSVFAHVKRLFNCEFPDHDLKAMSDLAIKMRTLEVLRKRSFSAVFALSR